MEMLRKGAPAKNMFGSLRRCDAIALSDYKPCPNRAAYTLIPELIQGTNYAHTYWCGPHADAIQYA
jgi:hypothetical protein